MMKQEGEVDRIQVENTGKHNRSQQLKFPKPPKKRMSTNQVIFEDFFFTKDDFKLSKCLFQNFYPKHYHLYLYILKYKLFQFIMQVPSNPMSNTKKNLLMIIKQEIHDLRPDVMQMNQQALLKQLAKQKVLYNLSKRSNELELVYAYMALSDYYITQEFYEPAIKNLQLARDIKETGDVLHLLGVCYFKTKKMNESLKSFDLAMKNEWIEPSIEHQKSSLLEGISYQQIIYYEKAKRYPEKKPIYQQKLVNLSYEKIKFTQHLDQAKGQLMMSENYYYALAMADLAQIFNQFGQHEMALSKIKTAISMIHEHGYGSKSDSSLASRQYKDRLIEFYHFEYLLCEKLGLEGQFSKILKEGMGIIKKKYQGEQGENTHRRENYQLVPKLSRLQQEIYYLYIKNNLRI